MVKVKSLFSSLDVGALLFTHGQPKESQGEAVSFWRSCAELDVAVVGVSECVLITETNSKALSWHVPRYERTAGGWRLKPRTELRLPNDEQTGLARHAVSAFLSKYSAIASSIIMATSKLADEQTLGSPVPQNDENDRVAISLVWSSDDINAVLAISRSVQGKLLVFAKAGALDANAGVAGLQHIVIHDALPIQSKDAFKIAVLYFLNSLGLDVLFIDPAAPPLEDPWTVVDLNSGADLLLYDQTQRKDANLHPYSASANFFFFRSNWRTLMLVDSLVYATDLALSSGFDATFAQLASEADSLFTLTVEAKFLNL